MSRVRRTRGQALTSNVRQLILNLVVTVSAVLFFLFVASDPNPQGTWLREGGVLEDAQALLFFLAAVGFFMAARRSDHLKQGQLWRYLPITAWILLMLVFFGEEISWGQRIFGLETPTTGVLSTNTQNEINLHNLPFLRRLKVHFVNYLLITVGLTLPLLTLLHPLKRAVRFFAIPISSLIFVPIFVGTFFMHDYRVYSFEEFGYSPREYSETMMALAFALFAWHGADNRDSLFLIPPRPGRSPAANLPD